MHRVVRGVLVLMLAIPALGAEDKSKDKPATPAEQYQKLLEQDQQDVKAYQDALKDAKTPEERQKIVREKSPKTEKLAPQFIELAEKNPKDPVAVDALIWVMTNRSIGGEYLTHRAKALELLARDHVQSEKLGRMCQSLGFEMNPRMGTFLRAIVEKNPHKDVQAEACLALAQILGQQAGAAKRIKDDPEMAKRYQDFVGKKQFEELKKMDVAKVEADSARFFKELAEKYAARLKPERLAQVCQRMSFSGDKSSEVFLRTLMEKDKRREVQGVACLTLAQVLKSRADETAGADVKAADKIRAESEKLFERAADAYADVKLPFRGTVGAKAKSELFDLRHLTVGKPAPEVEGEDQDGKKFKLGDYKGKVVLLDFWSQF